MKLSKKLLLPALFSAVPAFAQPFTVMDARSMAMGDTGTASANAGTAGLFNPALLSNNTEDKNIHVILPNIGVSAFADPDALDSLSNIEDADYFDNISNSLDAMNTSLAGGDPNAYAPAQQSLTNNMDGLTQDLNELSEKPFRINAAAFTSISIPSETLGVSVFANANATIETTPIIDPCDTDIMNDYTAFIGSYTEAELETLADDLVSNGDPMPQATCTNSDGTSTSIDIISAFDDGNGGVDITLNNPVEADPLSGEGYELASSVLVAGVTITEIGVALSHKFDILGQKISFGITPKFQTIISYYATPTTQELDDDNYDLADEFEGSEKEDNAFNLDFGVSTNFLADDSLTIGLSIKNLISSSYETSVSSNGSKAEFDIDMLARAGVSWAAPLGFSLAADLDLTKNKPYFTGEDTQFLGAGVEWDMLNIMRLRGGMRTNLVDSDDSVITAGIGFNIVAVYFDLAAQYSENNAGAALQIGMEF